MSFKKYRQYPIVENICRTWPNKQIVSAPIYGSVDLRDGNQALVNPLSIEQKLEYFNTLVKMGFKHIEVSYPSASDTDFDFTRKLIEENLIPDDVFIQILIPAKKELIKRSVEAMKGVKNGIFHLYNPTNEFQKRVVFKKTDEEIISMAVEGMKYLKELTKDFEGNVIYDYSPESFSQTNLDFALKICNEVIAVIDPSKEKKMIINLPNTLEACTANVYADRIEWMCNNLSNREALIVSVHPHNDRGTAVASAELAILAGANRVEGTLFGNGERAGNLDLVNFAFNIHSQGIDSKLDLSFIDEVKKMYEEKTNLTVHPRHPFVGNMIFTAFSGGHQDAIKKGIDFYRQGDLKEWNVPYLPIDPKDINRGYEDVIRVNSQSGKGGVSFIISEFLGESLSKQESIEFGKIVKDQSDKLQRELSKEEIISLYQKSKETNSWNADKYKEQASFVSNLASSLVEVLDAKKEESILDLGCGDGTLAAKIQESGAKVKAIDLSSDMIRKAKEKGIDASVEDITQISYEKKFDAIFSNAVLHWVKDKQRALEGINKSLKDKGRFVAEFGGFGNIKTVVDSIACVFEKNPEFGSFNNPWYFPSDEEYRKLLEENGFQVEFCKLITRATPISNMEDWLDIFANGIIKHLSFEQKTSFKKQVIEIAKPKLYTKENGWVLDYVRIRVKAIKVLN